MHRFLLSTSFLVILTTPAAHAGERPLNPRIDTGFKLGTERGIVTTEIWVPVRQAPDRVLYGDARLTGDDRDNFEGNLGGGYRHIYGETVLGAHAWIDRRKTARGSTFNQATVGVEALGRDVDARLNAYVPLSGPKTYATPNMGRDAPYLAGSGVFYDTTGQMVEEPQGGFDIELGARLPLFEQRVDSIRVYGGFYHFGGDETPNVTGWRARVSADVTPQLQLGARFQKDSERGSQGFLEATLRFPGKASFRREGLRARLDESPERDVDIVTGAAVTDSGIGKPVLDPTGNPQRVLHVDNTASGDGKGTNESPYATLRAAEAAMKAYDVIYVREGDGGTTGQNLGIVIDKPNVSLIGSGVDLVYEGGRVTGAAAGTTTGTVLAAATAKPVITNTQASGDGVQVTSDNAGISGLMITYTLGNGVLVLNANNADISDLTVQNSGRTGVEIRADGAGQTASGTAADSQVLNSTNRGIWINAINNGVTNGTVLGNVVDGAVRGIQLGPSETIIAPARVTAIAEWNTVRNTTQINIHAISRSANNETFATIRNNTVSGATTHGIEIQSGNGSRTEATVENNESKNNVKFGIWAWSLTTGTTVASVSGNTTTGNGQNGINIGSLNANSLADLGGGSLGSTGGNRMFGNVGPDLKVSIGATELKAENNWWGQAGGPLPGQIDLGGGSTIDALPFLAADPGL